jgi:hypothetical protein
MTACETTLERDDLALPASSGDVDNQLARLINDSGLSSSGNRFFQAARAVRQVDGEAALRIAHYWREVTKTFMLTTIAGVGRMAEEASRQADPPRHYLGVMQTIFRVIGDDLNNEMHLFKAVAPVGVGGIHYVWWEDSILRPVAERLRRRGADQMPGLPSRVVALQELMHRMSRSPLGTAVQLRVVEAIALDVVVAFKRVFTRLVIGGSKVFPAGEQLAWMNSHIQAEVAHHSEVSNQGCGMASLADTEAKQKEMLGLTAGYARAWNAALEDFAAALG